MKTVAVLFAREDSVYKSLPGCDVWDIERDARKWPGGAPVIGHPPCRAWGALKHFAKPRPDEKALAPWCIDQIRKWGGVLEHPAGSSLWPAIGLPQPGRRDAFGGWTLPIDQDWWGHRAEKRTRLYIVGCDPQDIPPMPYSIEPSTHVVSTSKNIRAGDLGYRPQLRKAEREKTPPALAQWLVDLARLCEAPP